MAASMEAKTESSFIQELEDRLNVIFAEDEKPKEAAVIETAVPAGASALDPINVVPCNEGGEDLFSDLNESHSVMFSHVKDLKSIVLSLEWEINDEILEKFDNEILRLEEIDPEDLHRLAFVRILRFLGRYIREKSAESEPRSINLLLSTYDNLEKVILSRKMPESEKYSLMLDNITAYRQWVEGVDLTPSAGAEAETREQTPARRPALQVLIGKQEKELQTDFARDGIAETPPADGTASELFTGTGYGDEAAPPTETGVVDTVTDARIFEDDPVLAKVPAFAGPVSPDEIRADNFCPAALNEGVPPGGTGQTEAGTEQTAGVSSGADQALAAALERVRQEIRSEIMEEVWTEIKALRDEIESLRAASR